jgi:hypothetical protein
MRSEEAQDARFSYDPKLSAAVDQARDAALRNYAFGPRDPDQAAFEYRDPRGVLHLFGTWSTSPGTQRENGVEIRRRDVQMDFRRAFGHEPAPQELQDFLIYLADIIAFYLDQHNRAVGGDEQVYHIRFS